MSKSHKGGFSRSSKSTWRLAGNCLGQKVGRSRNPYFEKEVEVIRAAHARYRFGACMVELEG
jgi:hypothetical protein